MTFDRRAFKASLKLRHFTLELESIGADLIDPRRTEFSRQQARDFGEVCDAMAVFLDTLISLEKQAPGDRRNSSRSIQTALGFAFDRYADLVSERSALGMPPPTIREASQ